MADKKKICMWKYDEYTDSWDTECNNKHQFMTDGPEENNYKFCPYCGRKLIPVKSKQERKK
jgi:hypothetical protein